MHATIADHLDVVGHFGTGDHGDYAGDWLPSHSGFDAVRFEKLWTDVAEFILAEARDGGGTATDAGTERTEHDLPNEPPAAG